MLEILVRALLPHVDLFLTETMSCVAEALAACDAVRGTGKPIWVSFNLSEIQDPQPRLRSNELVTDAVAAAVEAGAEAILFNCSPPEVIGPAVDAAYALLGPHGPLIGVYANAFHKDVPRTGSNKVIRPLRQDISTEHFHAWALDWHRRGASIIGGCCGIGPEHISTLRAAASNLEDQPATGPTS